MKVKVLVIGHSNFNSNYGAATSIRNHFLAMGNNPDIVFDHVFRRDLVIFKLPRKNIQKINNVISLGSIWLPISNKCFEHTSPGLIKNFLSIYLPNFIFRLRSKSIIKFLEEFRPDVIHLNSITLIPLISYLSKSQILNRCNIILHIRELIDVDYVSKYYDSFKYVSNFICIDYAVYERLRLIKSLHINSTNSLIQQNPFKPNDILAQELSHLFCDDTINFCIAGVIGEDKGVEFVCESFLRADLVNSKLFIIGRINDHGETLRKKYRKFIDKIVWTGEISDLADTGIFSKIHCLIRGEKQFCTGRTVYESLYSGSKVLLPGNDKNLADDQNLKQFRKQIRFYLPRNINSLVEEFKTVYSNVIIEKLKSFKEYKVKSNFENYSSIFSKKYYDLKKY